MERNCNSEDGTGQMAQLWMFMMMMMMMMMINLVVHKGLNFTILPLLNTEYGINILNSYSALV
jgi:hypothetical protein